MLPSQVMFLRNHGVVCCGSSIEEAFHICTNTSNIYLMTMMYFKNMLSIFWFFHICTNTRIWKQMAGSRMLVLTFQFASCCLWPPSEDDASRPRQPRSHRRWGKYCLLLVFPYPHKRWGELSNHFQLPNPVAVNVAYLLATFCIAHYLLFRLGGRFSRSVNEEVVGWTLQRRSGRYVDLDFTEKDGDDDVDPGVADEDDDALIMVQNTGTVMVMSSVVMTWKLRNWISRLESLSLRV